MFGMSNPILDLVSNVVERTCDAAGLPEEVGDLASAATNICTGNYGGLIDDGADLLGYDGGAMELAAAILPPEAQGLLAGPGGGMGMAPPGMGAPAGGQPGDTSSPLAQLLQQLVAQGIAQGAVPV